MRLSLYAGALAPKEVRWYNGVLRPLCENSLHRLGYFGGAKVSQNPGHDWCVGGEFVGECMGLGWSFP